MEELRFAETKGSVSDLLHLLQPIFAYLVKTNYSFATWRQPGETTLNFIIDADIEKAVSVGPELETMNPGFLVSPFENESNSTIYRINAGIHISFTLKDNHYSINFSANEYHPLIQDLMRAVEESSSSKLENPYINPVASIKNTTDSKDQFIEMVTEGIKNINNGLFNKVVPARVESIPLKENFSLAVTFLDLEKTYPFAFVSLFHLRGHGIWMGASPEILIQIRDKRHFTTTAVAGTQLANPDIPLSNIGWTQKEIVEQAMVSRYIINCFKKIRLREFDESGPKTVKAGNLLHLRTDYVVDLEEVDYPQLGSVMLKLLHPTSAICGMPKEPTMSFIKQHESFNRSFFSGFIGPVNIDNLTSLYVNIRCAQIFRESALIYAGAGVTADSVPEKEWTETEIKLKTMEDILS